MTSQRATAAEHEAFALRLAAIDEPTIAWFGGWLCADGSIKAGPENGRPCIRFVITDLDPLDKFATLFGNKVGGPHPPSGLGVKDRYEWQISGWRAAMILERVRPWLSTRYGERADVFADWAPRGHAGRLLDPEMVSTIKAALAAGGHGTGRRLAREYGVSEQLISAIRHGRCWVD